MSAFARTEHFAVTDFETSLVCDLPVHQELLTALSKSLIPEKRSICRFGPNREQIRAQNRKHLLLGAFLKMRGSAVGRLNEVCWSNQRTQQNVHEILFHHFFRAQQRLVMKESLRCNRDEMTLLCPVPSKEEEDAGKRDRKGKRSHDQEEGNAF